MLLRNCAEAPSGESKFRAHAEEIMAVKIATFDDWMDLFPKWQKDIGSGAQKTLDNSIATASRSGKTQSDHQRPWLDHRLARKSALKRQKCQTSFRVPLASARG
jgi:hypothetical protein